MRGVVVKSIDEAAVRRAMDAYAARLLATHPEVEEIVVFGSFLTVGEVMGWLKNNKTSKR